MSKFNSKLNNTNKTLCKTLHLILNKQNHNLLLNKKKLKFQIIHYSVEFYFYIIN